MMFHRFSSPRDGWVGRLHDRIVAQRRLRAIRRAVMPLLPFPVLASDVRDVVYLNWVVDAARAAEFVPPGVTLVEREGRVILTVLTYRHRHFGPVLLGPLRRLFGSPCQSNWRFYADRIAGRSVAATVLFIANILDSAFYTLGTRVLSDALPSDLAGRFVHRRDADTIATVIDGGGSAPALSATVRDGAERVLPSAFSPFFADWRSAISGLCLQDAAICAVDDLPGRLALARIALPIDPARVRPMTCLDYRGGALLARLGATDPPFCFCVTGVPFRVVSERLIAVDEKN